MNAALWTVQGWFVGILWVALIIGIFVAAVAAARGIYVLIGREGRAWVALAIALGLISLFALFVLSWRALDALDREGCKGAHDYQACLDG